MFLDRGAWRVAASLAVLRIATPGLAAPIAPLSGSVQQISGKVLWMDPWQGTLTLEQGTLTLEAEEQLGSTLTTRLMDVAITEKTVITDASRKVQPEDLRFGERVEIDYVIEHGTHIAKLINLRKPREPRAPVNPESIQSLSQ